MEEGQRTSGAAVDAVVSESAGRSVLEERQPDESVDQTNHSTLATKEPAPATLDIKQFM